jgi:SHS2 domain-containing protein
MSDPGGSISPREAGHRVLPHTADVIVEAWAPSRAGCLEELVRGAVETFADTRGVKPTREIALEVGAARDEDVIIALLDDVCYLLDADGLVVVDIVLEEEEDANFDGTFLVAPVDVVVPTGATPKGVSRSDLQFGLEDGVWRARVIVDV